MEIKIIQNYILYLIKDCGLSVSLHPFQDETLISGSTLMNFNIHDNSYCAYIKSLPNGTRNVSRSKRKFSINAAKQTKAFATFVMQESKNIFICCTTKKA